MMSANRGKSFEERLKEDWERTVPGSSIDRIYDTVNGLRGVSNVCDFICFRKPNIFFLEVKSHKGNTFPFVNLPQYEKLSKKIGIDGVRAGVVIWFYEHDRVIYVPASTIRKMKADGLKSVNIKTIGADGYRYVEIPSEKMRVYMKSDYSVLLSLNEGE